LKEKGRLLWCWVNFLVKYFPHRANFKHLHVINLKNTEYCMAMYRKDKFGKSVALSVNEYLSSLSDHCSVVLPTLFSR
jgi:hypothetical protein